jgi:hypothetical protein
MATPTKTANQMSPAMAKHPGCVAWWPTPSANNYEQKDLDALLERRARIKAEKKNGNGFGLTLGNAVRMIPTPSATQHKGSSQAALTRKDGKDRTFDRLDHYAMATAGGSLNPAWVEWLMAWPLGWTVSKHWVTAKSQRKQRSCGES